MSGEISVEELFDEVTASRHEFLTVGTRVVEMSLKGEISCEIEEHPDYVAAQHRKDEAETRLASRVTPPEIFPG